MSEDAFDRTMKAIVKRKQEIVPLAVLAAYVVIIFLAWCLWAGGSRGLALWAGAADISEAEVPVRTATAGVWGDSFGGFNALFGALGFGAIASTLFLQYRALQEQKRDQHLQRFEATFFELLRLIREMRDHLAFSQTEEMKATTNKKYVSTRSRRGYDAIKFAAYEVRHWVLSNKIVGRKVTRKMISDRYVNVVHKRFESRFAPYFRIIYTVLHKIREDDILDEEQKAYYGNLLRAQLSTYEIALLAMNATAPVAKDLFEHLVYFRMLKYIPDGRFRVLLKDVYPKIAFEARD